MTAPGTRTAWTFLGLPPVLLAVIIATTWQAMGLGPPDAQADARIRSVLPLIILVNHTVVLAALLIVTRRQGTSVQRLGWSLEGSRWPREIAVGIAGALVVYLFKELVVDSGLALLDGRTPTFRSLFRFRTEGLEVPMALVATGLVFVEETVYRGLAIPVLARRHGTLVAVLATSIAFGLLHWGNGPEGIAVTTTYGLLFAALFLWRRNVLATTVAHALYNLAVLST